MVPSVKGLYLCLFHLPDPPPPVLSHHHLLASAVALLSSLPPVTSCFSLTVVYCALNSCELCMLGVCAPEQLLLPVWVLWSLCTSVPQWDFPKATCFPGLSLRVPPISQAFGLAIPISPVTSLLISHTFPPFVGEQAHGNIGACATALRFLGAGEGKLTCFS